VFSLLSGMTWRRTSLVVVDHALIILGILAAVWLRFTPPTAVQAWDAYLWKASLTALVLQVALYYCDLYDLRTLHDARGLVVGLMRGLGAASVLLALFYYWVPQLTFGRGVFLISAAIVIGPIALWRIVFEWLSVKVGPAERILIVGTSGAAAELERELLARRHELGVEITGFVDKAPAAAAEPRLDTIGSIDDIPALVKRHAIHRVVVNLADARGSLPMQKLLEMKLKDGIRFDHLASVYEEYTGKIAVEHLRPSWLVFSGGFRKTQTLAVAKRFIDIFTATIGLLLSWPLMLLVALGIKLTSPGPIFHHQKRVGLNNRIVTIHKFRSMRPDAEAKTGAVWSQVNDPRVTPIGRFLRRTRLDELPQLWNVLIGEMSFVGPRPERPEFVEGLTESIPFYGQRHVVRPGLTGWAQVRHSYGASVADSLQKLQYDLFYIKNMSVAFDLFIMLETVRTVLMRKGS
jgi:sugar transferase (PEP-CTERM system associated)